MTDTNFIADTVASGHRAQIIHQNGVLIYANIAAAHVFGFLTIADFAKFAKTTDLLVGNPLQGLHPRNRILTFRCAVGQQKRAHLKERHIVWNGARSTHLEVEPVEADTASFGAFPSDISNTDAEDYILDTMGAAMDWTRIDGNNLEIVFQPFNLANATFQLCDDLAEYAKNSGVAVIVEVMPRAQNVFQGDALKFARAASCMLRHAIDRSLGGRVDVSLKADEQGEHVMFEVCDNSVPYKLSDSKILFDLPNNHDDSSHSSAKVNLPLARCIARYLGGEVSFKVNYSNGGLVRMRLPFRILGQDSATTSSGVRKHQNLNLLVVEDNLTSQHVIKVILETLGHHVTLASNGKESLDILQRATFDLILMDLHMPIKDGYSTIQAIRKRESLGNQIYEKPIPILAISADTRPKTRNMALDIGVTGFLTKPIHVPQIMSALAPFVEGVLPTVSNPKPRFASRGV